MCPLPGSSTKRRPPLRPPYSLSPISLCLQVWVLFLLINTDLTLVHRWHQGWASVWARLGVCAEAECLSQRHPHTPHQNCHHSLLEMNTLGLHPKRWVRNLHFKHTSYLFTLKFENHWNKIIILTSQHWTTGWQNHQIWVTGRGFYPIRTTQLIIFSLAASQDYYEHQMGYLKVLLCYESNYYYPAALGSFWNKLEYESVKKMNQSASEVIQCLRRQSINICW